MTNLAFGKMVIDATSW